MIDTPVGVDRVADATGRDRDEITAVRAAQVPMRRQGSAWNIADEADGQRRQRDGSGPGVTGDHGLP